MVSLDEFSMSGCHRYAVIPSLECLTRIGEVEATLFREAWNPVRYAITGKLKDGSPATLDLLWFARSMLLCHLVLLVSFVNQLHALIGGRSDPKQPTRRNKKYGG